MNLLYVWNEAYSGGRKDTGYLLSSRYKITFARQEGRLSICRKDSLSEGCFWGEHIYDVMAVIGNNGAGKTQLAYCIMETLDEASRLEGDVCNSQQGRFPFLLVFEDHHYGEPEILIFSANLRLSVDTVLRYRRPRWDDLERFKFAYFTDSLSLTDYNFRKYGVVHDGSLGGGIRRTSEFNREMHYSDSAMSPIIDYFDDEMEKILEFVFFHHGQENIPFVIPKAVTFSTKSYWPNLKYISDELDRMGESDGKDILQKKCTEIQSVYDPNIFGTLPIHLMLNLFKCACIPQTSSEDLREQTKKFLAVMERMEWRDEAAFDRILRLFEQLDPLDNRNIVKPYIDMVLWLKEQPALQNLRKWEKWSMRLPEERETAKELFRHYRKTKFPYPYFSISFGLSTGEYALLRRFVRLSELLNRKYDGQAYVTNQINHEVKCDSLMLYFDEADQSLHPEWQRKQLDWLLQFVSTQFETCASQLVIATHSPIVLSDIPRENVLYLQNNGDGPQVEQRETRTFGSNIHTLFRDAFFLNDGTMGAFAERKINEVARSLQDYSERISPETEKLIEAVGDNVIRNKLRQMMKFSPSSKFRAVNRSAKEETIRLLRGQVERLEAAIRELERIEYD